MRVFGREDRKLRAVRAMKYLVGTDGGSATLGDLYSHIRKNDPAVARSECHTIGHVVTFIHGMVRRGWFICPEEDRRGHTILAEDRVVTITPSGRIWLDHLEHESEFELLDRFSLLCLVRAHQIALKPFGTTGVVARDSGTVPNTDNITEDDWNMAAELVRPSDPLSVVFPWSEGKKRKSSW